jgi:hypothetical protein
MTHLAYRLAHVGLMTCVIAYNTFYMNTLFYVAFISQKIHKDSTKQGYRRADDRRCMLSRNLVSSINVSILQRVE